MSIFMTKLAKKYQRMIAEHASVLGTNTFLDVFRGDFSHVEVLVCLLYTNHHPEKLSLCLAHVSGSMAVSFSSKM